MRLLLILLIWLLLTLSDALAWFLPSQNGVNGQKLLARAAHVPPALENTQLIRRIFVQHAANFLVMSSLASPGKCVGMEEPPECKDGAIVSGTKSLLLCLVTTSRLSFHISPRMIALQKMPYLGLISKCA